MESSDCLCARVSREGASVRPAYTAKDGPVITGIKWVPFPTLDSLPVTDAQCHLLAGFQLFFFFLIYNWVLAWMNLRPHQIFLWVYCEKSQPQITPQLLLDSKATPMLILPHLSSYSPVTSLFALLFTFTFIYHVLYNLTVSSTYYPLGSSSDVTVTQHEIQWPPRAFMSYRQNRRTIVKIPNAKSKQTPLQKIRGKNNE